tara:strand:+ start:367 stop:621 length:255 start_codon:yes stop_codon:yes gene_type:complete
MDLGKEPNPPFPVEIIDVKPVEVANPYSGQKVTLQPTAIAVYDCIKGAEMMADGDFDDKHLDTVRKGIEWFQMHYPKEYMVLLD